MLLALVFITGFCSMVYELALAQLLSSLLGNTFLRYATTLGVYITAMGIGSIVFKPSHSVSERKWFFRAEVALTISGILAPFLYIFIYSFAQAHETLVIIVTHVVVALVGFLSGFELPILSSLAERKNKGSSSKVLAFDYIGMFVGAVLFPLFLYPLVGIFSLFWIVTLLNLAAAVATLYLPLTDGSKLPATRMLAALGSLAFANLLLLSFSRPLENFLSALYAAA